MKQRFKKPKLPNEPFLLVGIDKHGHEWDERVVDPRTVGDNGGNEFVIQAEGSPFFIRCVRQEGSHLWLQSGDGLVTEYRIGDMPVLNG